MAKFLIRVDGEDFSNDYLEWEDQIVKIVEAHAVRFIQVEADDAVSACKKVSTVIPQSELVYGEVVDAPFCATIEYFKDLQQE